MISREPVAIPPGGADERKRIALVQSHYFEETRNELWVVNAVKRPIALWHVNLRPWAAFAPPSSFAPVLLAPPSPRSCGCQYCACPASQAFSCLMCAPPAKSAGHLNKTENLRSSCTLLLSRFPGRICFPCWKEATTTTLELLADSVNPARSIRVPTGPVPAPVRYRYRCRYRSRSRSSHAAFVFSPRSSSRRVRLLVRRRLVRLAHWSFYKVLRASAAAAFISLSRRLGSGNASGGSCSPCHRARPRWSIQEADRRCRSLTFF